jgi:solute carrier family 5 (high affinity choline transporter), member 7
MFGQQIFCIPFVWNHPSIDLDLVNKADWIGTVPTSSLGSYIDIYLLIILGGIPWQVGAHECFIKFPFNVMS